MLFGQLKALHEPISDEALDSCRIRLANAADHYQRTSNDLQGFSLEAEHFKVIKNLRNNSDIAILRPDKGQGVVLMKKVEYVRKMLDILNDPSKFKRLGNCSECDNTGSLERSMQTLLLRLHKAGEISESTYKKI